MDMKRSLDILTGGCPLLAYIIQGNYFMPRKWTELPEGRITRLLHIHCTFARNWIELFVLICKGQLDQAVQGLAISTISKYISPNRCGTQ